MRIRAKILGLLLLLSTSVLGQSKEIDFAYANYHQYYKKSEKKQDNEKEEAIKKLRLYFAKHPYRMYKVKPQESAQWYLDQLNEDGIFTDLITEEKVLRKNLNQRYKTTSTDRVGIFIGDALNRIYFIANGYRKGKLKREQALSSRVMKAILHYGTMEASRSNKAPRFHASCFAIPTTAVNIYFALLEDMDRAERGEGDKLLKEACDMLKVMGLQAYTQPLRHDETDRNVVSIERFRNHVWWVGGNALAYRSLLPVAAMYSSIPMVDVVAEVCQKGISRTSQQTNESSFWTEGFTADGAGWGHGMQSLIWGYPIDGTFNALNILGMLKGTPWGKQLTYDNTYSILNFLRGGSWYYYKGYTLPCLDRASYAYTSKERAIPYKKMLNQVISNWIDSFTEEEQAELLALQKEVKNKRITMRGAESGLYQGTRWFYNNDDLIKSNDAYHLMINASSVRCDGLESAVGFADEYNFYPTDGMTLIQRTGDEYWKIMGAWDMTASPGITAREGMERLEPVTNWRGYCSMHNFAGAATRGGENAVMGYLFEKMNASKKKGVNDKGSGIGKNSILYGVKAHKGYFIMGDYMVALGAGVSNLTPQEPGNIRTTIDQTAWSSEVYLVNDGDKKPISEGVVSWNSDNELPTWLVQKDKFAYTLLPAYTDRAYVTCAVKPNEWIKRNRSNKKRKNLPQEASILHVWVDHGECPMDDKYGYVVYMGKGVPSGPLPFDVLRNDKKVQAIRSKDGSVLQAILYPNNEGLQSSGIQLKTSHPCVIQIENEPDETYFTVTDATMNGELKEIEVLYNGHIDVLGMPQGEGCGAPSKLLFPWKELLGNRR